MKPLTLKQQTILTIAMIAALFLLVALMPAEAVEPNLAQGAQGSV